MENYTLVIPTYNRETELRDNLRFLESQEAGFKILVLDSSEDACREANRATIGSVQLDISYFEYGSETSPFLKFQDGLSKVQTPYCSLCADDDLLLLPGLYESIEALDENEKACVAHGFYFMFGKLQGKPGLDLTTMLYYSPSITQENPILRLQALMSSYQALTYGVFRRESIQLIYDRIPSVENLMFRELLSGSLAAIRGQIIRVPSFYMGRAHDTKEQVSHRNWHPLEWFLRDRKGMFAEYVSYRETLSQFLDEAEDFDSLGMDKDKLLDFVHFCYLADHMPRGLRETVLEHELGNEDLDAYWGDPKIQIPLVDAHYASSSEKSSETQSLQERLGRSINGSFEHIRDRNSLKWPVEMTTSVRSYRLHRSFLNESIGHLLPITDTDLKALLNRLDLYPLEYQSDEEIRRLNRA